MRKLILFPVVCVLLFFNSCQTPLVEPTEANSSNQKAKSTEGFYISGKELSQKIKEAGYRQMTASDTLDFIRSLSVGLTPNQIKQGKIEGSCDNASHCEVFIGVDSDGDGWYDRFHYDREFTSNPNEVNTVSAALDINTGLQYVPIASVLIQRCGTMVASTHVNERKRNVSCSSGTYRITGECTYNDTDYSFGCN